MNDKALGEAMEDLHGYNPNKEDKVSDGNYTPEWLNDRRVDLGMPTYLKTSREPGETDDRLLLADVAFNRHSMNDGHHVGPSDNGTIVAGTDGIEVRLVQGINEGMLRRTLSAATRATIGLSVEEMDNLVDTGDSDEMFKGGLQTALESQVIVFAVSGASRTCTHQLVRSRRAAFHQQSQRASYMGDAPEVRCPESIWRNPRAFKAFAELTMKSWETYRICCEEDISYQDSRFALLEGTTNFILLEYPVREFLNVYAYRACSMFQWEIVEVMRKCRDALVAEHPFMEPHVKISCEKLQRCTFQGWEDVEGQCDFPWAKHELRTFQPEHHRITRKS